MIDMRFLESHVGTLDDAIKLADQFDWAITIKKEGDKWFVLTGEKVALATNSRETVEAFLYGMGLAYSIIPEQLVDTFREMHDI